MGETSGAASRALVERAADWLMAQALKDADLKDIVRGCCERLHGAGVPIARAQFSFTLLHPLYRGVGVPLVVTPRSRLAYLTSLESYEREGPGVLVDFVFERGLEAMTQAFDILAASALS